MTKQELRNGLVEALMQTEYLNEWYGMHGLIMMIEALDKDIKYKWHDLMKDPNDLPKEEIVERILIYEEYYSYKEEKIVNGYYLTFWCNGTFNVIGRNQKTLAWKYIEPFNEEI